MAGRILCNIVTLLGWKMMDGNVKFYLVISNYKKIYPNFMQFHPFINKSLCFTFILLLATVYIHESMVEIYLALAGQKMWVFMKTHTECIIIS